MAAIKLRNFNPNPTWEKGDIACAKCGEILSADYDRDRGHADSNLYTHVCKPCVENEMVRQGLVFSAMGTSAVPPEPVLRYKSELTRAMDYLATDPRVRFIGNQVAVKGNAMTGTLANVPREKLIEMPVAEELQMGMSIGLWMAGFIPVTIYPRFNFLLRATDQVVNHLDKFKKMSDGRVQPKVIIRTSIGSVKPLNPQCQHTGDFTAAFVHLCDNIEVIRLDVPGQIFRAYERALTREDGKSTLLVEWGDLYLEK